MKSLGLVFLFLSFLLAGCGADLPWCPTDGSKAPTEEDIESLLAKAVDGGTLEKKDGEWVDGDGPFTGTAKWMHPNGKTEKLIEVKDGKQKGYFVTWHPNGKFSFKGHFVDDLECGLWQEFSESGAKLCEYHYEKGVRAGAETKWHESGQKQWEGQYDEGSKSGTWTYWEANGTVQRTEDH